MPPVDDMQDVWLSGPLPSDPLPRLREWFDDATAQERQPNPNALTLATTEPDGRPAARVVLCKALDTTEGWLSFYTNLRSPKSRDLRERPYAAAVFHWDHLARQVRAQGPVVSVEAAEADAYFASRPLEAQLAAWTSRQSEPIDSRATLLERLHQTATRFSAAERHDGSLPRPDFWGGYRLWFERLELWVSRPGRVHDRALWTRVLRPSDGQFVGGPWQTVRLQP